MIVVALSTMIEMGFTPTAVRNTVTNAGRTTRRNRERIVYFSQFASVSDSGYVVGTPLSD
jgi:hypothetical protein